MTGAAFALAMLAGLSATTGPQDDAGATCDPASRPPTPRSGRPHGAVWRGYAWVAPRYRCVDGAWIFVAGYWRPTNAFIDQRSVRDRGRAGTAERPPDDRNRPPWHDGTSEQDRGRTGGSARDE